MSNSRHARGISSAPFVKGLNEWSVMGTSCDRIEEFVRQFRIAFPSWTIAYADEDHSSGDHSSMVLNWQKKSNGFRLEGSVISEDYDRRLHLRMADMTIVNGNHFEAPSQVIIADERKRESLGRRAGWITNPVAIVCPDNVNSCPDWLQDILGERVVPVLRMDEVFLTERLLHLVWKRSPLKGLILAGGLSTRMGKDKNLMEYHGIPQFEYLAGELHKAGIESSVSCRAEQVEFFSDRGFEVFPDRILDCGPLGGIISTFLSDPTHARLVVATDMPGWCADAAVQLQQAREIAHAPATAFTGENGLPEPLAAIWEPRMLQRAMAFLSLGVSCPRKILIHSGSHLITPSNPQFVRNVNTPDEAGEFLNAR